MSGKERGVFQLIYKHFIASFRPANKPHLMGEDYYGTKYYEVSAKGTQRKKASRYFVPVNEDDHEQEVPAEWEAWLRHRRKQPPTKEELEENYRISMLKKENAAKLEATYSTVKLGESKTEKLEERRKFPIYEEYKHHGKDYKIK